MSLTPPLIGPTLDTVRARRVEWLWPGYLAFGAVTILDGQPGEGKSQLTVDLAARYTTGRAMPFEKEALAPPGNVLALRVVR